MIGTYLFKKNKQKFTGKGSGFTVMNPIEKKKIITI